MNGKRPSHRKSRRMALALAGILLAGGCTVGPNFQPPPTPQTAGYSPPPPAAADAAPVGIHYQTGAALPAVWWQVFKSPALNELVETGLRGNLGLAAAQQRLRAARERSFVASQDPALLLDASAAISNRRFSAAQLQSGDGTFNLYSIGTQVSYSPDVFGALRRTAERQQALAGDADYELQAARLSVSGNLVVQAIDLAGAEARLAVLKQLADLDRQRLALAQAMIAAGKWPTDRRFAFQEQAQRTAAAVLPLRRQRDADRILLSTLVGRAPADWRPPALALDALALPGELPLSVPSQLVRQRPDILAAEALLHAANADVGIATAALYPTVTISASTLFSLGIDFSMPLFHWEALQAGKRGAEAAYQAALADYRKTVIDAFGQVATALSAIQHDQEALAATDGLADTAQTAVAMAQAQRTAGRTDRFPVLDAELQRTSLRLERIQATVQLCQDIAGLELALGGSIPRV